MLGASQSCCNNAAEADSSEGTAAKQPLTAVVKAALQAKSKAHGSEGATEPVLCFALCLLWGLHLSCLRLLGSFLHAPACLAGIAVL